MVAWKAFMGKYMPGADLRDDGHNYGFAATSTLIEVLKRCGDNLTRENFRNNVPLGRLGVLEQVMAQARPASHVGCIGPIGGRVDVPGTVAVLPRRQLDHVLVRAAQRAGAALHTPWRFEAPRVEAERVTGARLRSGNRAHELSARWVVLATGAPPQAMLAAGLCQRRTPTGVRVERPDSPRRRQAALQAAAAA